jgi:hypothetical protein
MIYTLLRSLNSYVAVKVTLAHPTNARFPILAVEVIQENMRVKS